MEKLLFLGVPILKHIRVYLPKIFGQNSHLFKGNSTIEFAFLELTYKQFANKADSDQTAV